MKEAQDALQAKLDEATAAKDALAAQLETAKTEAEAQVKAAQDAAAAQLETAKTEAEAQLKAAQETAKAELDSVTKDLTAQVEAAVAEKTGLEEKIQTLTAENETLKKAADFAGMDLESLQGVVEQLKAPLEKLGYTLSLEKKAE